jgi:hypothetical protein
VVIACLNIKSSFLTQKTTGNDNSKTTLKSDKTQKKENKTKFLTFFKIILNGTTSNFSNH